MLTMTDRALCRHLEEYHKGQEHAASSKELEAALHIREAELWQAINRLRCNGHLICSNETGYFYAARPAEIKTTIAQLTGCISKMIAATKEPLESYEEKEG